MRQGTSREELADVCQGTARAFPLLAAPLQATLLDVPPDDGLAHLLRRVLHPVRLAAPDLESVARTEFRRHGDLAAAALEDLGAMASRNLKSGGAASTWIGNRRLHVPAAHRLLHSLVA